MPDNQIEGLLDQMHVAILHADFAALDPLAQALELEMAALRQPDEPLLRRISHKAMRNATCLQAAGRGVRAAQRRVAEVRQTSSRLVTYDDSGKRAELGASGQLARRL